MKKLSIVVDILLDILLVFIIILSISLFAEEQPAQTADPLSQRLMKLEKELKLDETQTAGVREILEKAHSQVLRDRETFKGNALSLIEAAFSRKERSDKAAEALLSPDQQEVFKKIKEMSFFDRELFTLTEGLMLDDDQAFTVEGILIEYFNKIEEMLPEGMRPGEEGEIMDRGDGGRGRPMGMPGGGHGFGGIERELQSKKNNSIRKILTKEQKELFEQINQDRKKKIKEMKKRMKERHD